MTREKKRASTLEHVLKYTGVFGGVQGLTILMSIVRTKLGTSILGPAGVALMGIYLSITEFVRSTTNFGIPFSSVRHMSELFEAGSDAEQRRFVLVVRTWMLWVAVLAAAVCLAGAPLLAHFFFKDEENLYARNIALLAPMLVALSITAGEISILKGMRRLKRVASISALGAVSTLLLTVPFFWSMGCRGIILALNVSTIAMTVIHLAFTLPLYPWRVALFSADVFREGRQLVSVGIPYVAAAIAGSGMTMALLALLKRTGTQEDVGFYSMGYNLMVTYAGIVYATFEADYFPRLSSVHHDRHRRNLTINQQIRACLLLISPLLIALMTAMPLVIRLLSSEAFLPAAGMAICAAFYMFLRGITTPISYTALACGDSRLYLLMEVIYDAASLALIVGCFHLWGITGTGIGLSLSALFDLLLIGGVYGRHYSVRIAAATWRLALTQALLVGATLVACMVLPEVWRYAVGLPLLALSLWRSYKILNAETTYIQKIRQRLHL